MKKSMFTLLTVALCAALQAQPVSNREMGATMTQAHKYLRGPASARQPARAFELFMQCAQQGNGRAMNELGLLYKKGEGTDASFTKAAEWFTKATAAGYTSAWYSLGMLYKDTLNYAKAYACFSNPAARYDIPCMYAQGYMLYKGLGCTQDYQQAARLFAQGAVYRKANSMYFLGLCYRNGYGVTANADSARYWLTLAANQGYQMAGDELLAQAPENTGMAGDLVNKLKAAQQSMPKSQSLDQYVKTEHALPPQDIIAGEYKGFLLKYDWSGQHVVQVNQLQLKLHYENNKLTGLWTEDDSLSVPLAGSLTASALVFDNMQYRKNGHYNPVVPELLFFKKASLQMVRNKDSLFLAGNLHLFSPGRKEPTKPMFVALVRSITAAETARPVNEPAFRAYPNPFTAIVTMDFTLQNSSQVVTQMFTLDGKQVYSNNAGTLEAGSYTLSLQPRGLPAGTYLLRLAYGSKIMTTKLVKQ